MNHILALQALELARHPHVVPAPGTFKFFGKWTLPTLVGEVLHAIAYYGSLGYKAIIIILSCLLLKVKGKVEVWKILVLLVLGWIGIPSLTGRTAHYTNDITQGSAVGTTGASLGLFLLLAGIFALVFYRMVMKPPVVKEEEVEQV